MSLALDVTLASGASASFWILNALHLNAITQTATICMDGHVNSTTQAAGCIPLTQTTISVTFVPTNVLPGGVSVMQALYAKIAQDPFFTGATYTNDGL